MNEENFADNAHLNPLGSIENSKNIAIKLKSLIKTKIKK